MALTPETSARIQLLRQKSRDGTITQEELREALAMLREDRAMSADTSAKSKARKSVAAEKKNINSDDLLGELDGL